MWRPSSLWFDVTLMNAGELDKVATTELRDLIDSHRGEVEKMKKFMPSALISECNESLNELEKYYKLRLSKGSKLPAKNKQPAQKGPAKVRKSATERYKELFGTQPTQDYRNIFGVFDRAGYAKWLAEQVRTAEGKAK